MKMPENEAICWLNIISGENTDIIICVRTYVYETFLLPLEFVFPLCYCNQRKLSLYYEKV